jgi:hypothetical protein
MAAARTTAKGKRVFVHVFEWPSSVFGVERLEAKVISAHLLANGQPLKFRQSEGKLEIDLPPQAPDPNTSVIALRTL